MFLLTERSMRNRIQANSRTYLLLEIFRMKAKSFCCMLKTLYTLSSILIQFVKQQQVAAAAAVIYIPPRYSGYMTEMATNYKPHKFNRYLCRVYAYRIKPQINGYNVAGCRRHSLTIRQTILS